MRDDEESQRLKALEAQIHQVLAPTADGELLDFSRNRRQELTNRKGEFWSGLNRARRKRLSADDTLPHRASRNKFRARNVSPSVAEGSIGHAYRRTRYAQTGSYRLGNMRLQTCHPPHFRNIHYPEGAQVPPLCPLRKEVCHPPVEAGQAGANPRMHASMLYNMRIEGSSTPMIGAPLLRRY